jgi:hypothetical protein
MNILKVMSGLGLTSGIKAKLLKMGVSEQDMAGVDFNNMQSLNEFAERIVPKLIKSHPQMAQQIKESGWLDSQKQQEVNTVIDAI